MMLTGCLVASVLLVGVVYRHCMVSCIQCMNTMYLAYEGSIGTVHWHVMACGHTYTSSQQVAIHTMYIVDVALCAHVPVCLGLSYVLVGPYGLYGASTSTGTVYQVYVDIWILGHAASIIKHIQLWECPHELLPLPNSMLAEYKFPQNNETHQIQAAVNRCQCSTNDGLLCLKSLTYMSNSH